jgi:hypothetical protein
MVDHKLFNFKNNNQRKYEIAYSLYKINDTKDYRPKFKNIVDFAKERLGYEQAMTYKMLAAGDKFIYYDSERHIYKNIFGAGYSISQLIQMTGYKIERLMLLHVQYIISPEMTVKKLKETLKQKLK